MTINFRRLKPEDRHELRELLYSAERQGCEYSFANLYLWGCQQTAMVEGWLAIFSHFAGRSVYMYPVGQGDPRPVIDTLMADARERGIPFRLYGMTEQEAEQMDKLYPGRFHFGKNRDSFDYVYEIGRLAELKGKKLQQKRNHVNRFLRENPDWRVQPIGEETLEICRDFTAEWYRQHALEHPHMDFKLEQVALDRAFRNFHALGMEGLLLYAGDRAAAMTMGCRLGEDTWDVNFEKADSAIEGAYPMINREYARYIREKHPEIRLLNREDDMGIPGLRKAKESYYPDFLLEKYTAVLLESYEED